MGPAQSRAEIESEQRAQNANAAAQAARAAAEASSAAVRTLQEELHRKEEQMKEERSRQRARQDELELQQRKQLDLQHKETKEFFSDLLKSVTTSARKAEEENLELWQRMTELTESLHKSAREQNEMQEAWAKSLADSQKNVDVMIAKLIQVQQDLKASEEDKKAAKEELEKAKKDLKNYERPLKWARMPPEELLEEAKRRILAEKHLVFDPTRMNIAVVGNNGTGKSSLIKALLHHVGKIDWDHADMPKTSHIMAGQIPNGMAKYDMPNMPVTLWDCMGSNGGNISPASYVQDMCLAAFPMMIVTIGNRFEEVHANLLWAVKNKFPNQRAIVVNAKADEIVRNLMDEGMTPQKAIQTIREAHKAEAVSQKCNLKVGGAKDPYHISDEDLFVISTKVISGKCCNPIPGAPLEVPEFLTAFLLMQTRVTC